MGEAWVRAIHLGQSLPPAEYGVPTQRAGRFSPYPAPAPPADALGRKIREVDPAGVTNTWTYSPDHPTQVQQVEINGRIMSQRYYDIMGRMITNITHGLTLRYAYDPLGRVLTNFYPDGSAEISVYDGDLLVQRVSRSNVTNTFVYDAAGRRIAVTNGRGNATSYAYLYPCQLIS